MVWIRSLAHRCSRVGNGAARGILFIVAPIAGCQNATRSPVLSADSHSVSQGSLVQHAVGDSVAHLVRVLAFDATLEQAKIYVRQPANVLVLAVQPGRDIEVIFPGGMTVKQLGANNFTFFMQRFELASRERGFGADTESRQRYEACVRVQAEYRRHSEQANKSIRDSTGKIIGRTPPVTLQEPPACDMLGDSKGGSTLYTKAMPPRAPSERYLVVLSSSSPVSSAELEERLATLTATAPDVVLTIEAIAAGIYVGKRGTWGGTFVSW